MFTPSSESKNEPLRKITHEALQLMMHTQHLSFSESILPDGSLNFLYWINKVEKIIEIHPKKQPQNASEYK